MPSLSSPTVLAIVGAVATTIGVLLITRAWRRMRITRESRGWPSAEGEIVEASVESNIEHDDKGSETTFAPRVIYVYTVDGTQYTNDQIRLGPRRWFPTPTQAQRHIRAYPPGRTLAVHHDPNNPAEAVLEANAAPSVVRQMVAGLVLTVAGIGLLVVAGLRLFATLR